MVATKRPTETPTKQQMIDRFSSFTSPGAAKKKRDVLSPFLSPDSNRVQKNKRRNNQPTPYKSLFGEKEESFMISDNSENEEEEIDDDASIYVMNDNNDIVKEIESETTLMSIKDHSVFPFKS